MSEALGLSWKAIGGAPVAKIELRPATVTGIPMTARRASLRPAFDLAAEAFERIARETPELEQQFRTQAAEIRGLCVALEFADFIALTD